MKNLIKNAILLASVIQMINPAYSKNKPFFDRENQEVDRFTTIQETEEEEYPEYPLLESPNVSNLIQQTWGVLTEERTLDKANALLDLLEYVSEEVRRVNPDKVLGEDPVEFAEGIISGIDEIRNYSSFRNDQHRIKCIWDYADQIIRYLGIAEYTIVG